MTASYHSRITGNVMITRLLTGTLILLPLIGLLSTTSALSAQQPAGSKPTPTTPKEATSATPSAPPSTVTAAVAAGVTPAPDYVIGPGDVLAIVFWREQEMSVEVVVRPDGR